jgi:hypothetical protein
VVSKIAKSYMIVNFTRLDSKAAQSAIALNCGHHGWATPDLARYRASSPCTSTMPRALRWRMSKASAEAELQHHTSKYVGVSWRKDRSMWVAKIQVGGK